MESTTERRKEEKTFPDDATPGSSKPDISGSGNLFSALNDSIERLCIDIFFPGCRSVDCTTCR
jgi:hypothetical protein